MIPLLRTRPTLARAIVVILAVKFTALGVIWAVWFSEPESKQLDRDRIGSMIYSSHSHGPQGVDAHAQP
jgi:hypothetical protein